MEQMRKENTIGRHLTLATLLMALTVGHGGSVQAQSVGRTAKATNDKMTASSGARNQKFDVVEATITDIQTAIKSKRLTATDLVNIYLARIKAYNGVCVDQPQGIL